MYAEGTTEEVGKNHRSLWLGSCTITCTQYLSQLKLGNATIDTKYDLILSITQSADLMTTHRVYPDEAGVHAPERLRAKFFESLEKLNRKKVRVFYLHAPDRSVPFEDTLGEVNKLYNEGRL